MIPPTSVRWELPGGTRQLLCPECPCGGEPALTQPCDWCGCQYHYLYAPIDAPLLGPLVCLECFEGVD